MTEKTAHQRRSKIPVNEALRRDNYKCRNCNDAANHAHHVVPLVKGGNHCVGNLVSLCEKCHGAIHGLDLTSHRELTKAGLRKAKARGVKLGGRRPNTITENPQAKARALARAEVHREQLSRMVSMKMSLQQMADQMTGSGYQTAKGGPISPTQIKRWIEYLGIQRTHAMPNTPARIHAVFIK